jgi:hypothetical protein
MTGVSTSGRPLLEAPIKSDSLSDFHVESRGWVDRMARPLVYRGQHTAIRRLSHSTPRMSRASVHILVHAVCCSKLKGVDTDKVLDDAPEPVASDSSIGSQTVTK